MNSEQQRIAIAKACGWTEIIEMRLPAVWGWYGVVPKKDRMDMRQLPDYLNDLNAMHEVEQILRDQAIDAYEIHLLTLIQDGSRIADFSKYPSDCIFHATASQRAEAFLKTLGLWVEDSNEKQATTTEKTSCTQKKIE